MRTFLVCFVVVACAAMTMLTHVFATMVLGHMVNAHVCRTTERSADVLFRQSSGVAPGR